MLTKKLNILNLYTDFLVFFLYIVTWNEEQIFVPIAGEKPFRCLFKTCLKRFRYKGDLSKHIKRYHPGHIQVRLRLISE